jgi:cysteinyl-tRNA synthetase
LSVDEDFNFAGGLAVLFELAKSLVKQTNILNHGDQITVASEVLFQQWQELCTLAEILGLDVISEPAIEPSADHMTDAEVNALVDQRNQARQSKNFAEADRIRQELEAQGIELIDKKGTTSWRYQ